MNKKTLRLALLLLLAASTVSAAAPAVISNPEQAPRQRVITYHELWRIGTGDDDPVLGPIHAATADAAGNVYLLDAQQQVLLKFSSAGEYLGLAARRGQGPGEIEQVYDVQLLGGDSLGLMKGFPAEIIAIGLDGRPRPSRQPQAPPFGDKPGFGMLFSFASRDGFLVVYGRFSRFAGQAQDHVDYVASIGADDKPRHCYGTHQGGHDFSRPITVDELENVFAHANWALGRHGEVYFAPDRDRWLIEVRDPDGNLLRTITRPARPHRRTDAEKEAAKNNYSFSSESELPPISYRMADTDPVITGLRFDGTHLLVSTATRDEADPGTATFDVLDAEGHLLEARTVKIPGCRKGDGLLPLDDGRIVCVKNLEAAIAAEQAGRMVQVGDRRNGARDEDADELEVILYGSD